jgi:hypothetical protein
VFGCFLGLDVVVDGVGFWFDYLLSDRRRKVFFVCSEGFVLGCFFYSEFGAS